MGKLGKGLYFALSMVFGMFVGYKLITFIENENLLKSVFAFIVLYIGHLISINIHEMGHFFFGKLFGQKLMSYHLGCFCWYYENDKYKFRIEKNKGFSGMCSMMPKTEDLSMKNLMLFCSGGIIFGLVSGVIFIIIGYMTENHYLRMFFNYMGILSIFINVMNMFPQESAGNPSDGKVVFSILLKLPYSDQVITRLQRATKLRAGARLRDIGYIEFEGEQANISNAIINYFVALDSNDSLKADEYIKYMEENIKLVPSQLLPSVRYELCYNNILNGNMDSAISYYNAAGKILLRDQDINGMRIKAYYKFYVDNNPAEALELAEAGLAVKDKFPSKGQGDLEADLINKLITTINETTV